MVNPIKLEQMPDAPPDLAPKVAKKVSEAVAGSSATIKQQLVKTMGGAPSTEAKLLRDDTPANSVADLKKFKEKFVDSAENIAAIKHVEEVRKFVHDEIFGNILSKTFKANTPEQEYKLEKIAEYQAKYKKDEAPHQTPPHGDQGGHGNQPTHGEENEPPAFISEQSGRNLGKVAAVPLAAGAIMGAEGVAKIPVIGQLLSKIPYLPQLGEAIGTGVTNLTNYLGLQTGNLATQQYLTALPTWLGTAGVGLGAGALGMQGLRWAKRLMGLKTMDMSIGLQGWNNWRTYWNIAKYPLKLAGASVYEVAATPFQLFGKLTGWGLKGDKWKASPLGRVTDWTKNTLMWPVNNFGSLVRTALGVGAGVTLAGATGGSSVILGASGGLGGWNWEAVKKKVNGWFGSGASSAGHGGGHDAGGGHP